ncbi:MAG: exo-alpha-sialidase [Armatimonadetes bacterium]|nr:exo-alpha-sialidase [Armatimonadota bacterium]MDE2206600.1 exo-alpha-sialidase [Armatimonadota bacterium]
MNASIRRSAVLASALAACFTPCLPAIAQNHRPILHVRATRSQMLLNQVTLPPPRGFYTPQLGGTWQLIGPAPLMEFNGFGVESGMSGRVADAAGSPTDANTIYLAPAGGGVWKTTNGGTSWVPLTDTEPDLAMGAIAVAPSNANVIYAGTGEANNAGDSRYGLGILVSTDAGSTWTLETGGGAFVGMTTSRIAVDPTNANIVYAAMGDFGANGSYGGGPGIYKSTDGGSTWTKMTSAITTSIDPFSDVAINPTTPSTVYCAVGNVGGSANNGVYESTDSGSTWTLLSGHPNGHTNGNVGWIHIAIAPSAPSTIYSVVENISTSGILGVWKTTNGGTSWSQLTSAPNVAQPQAWYDMPIGVSPTNASVVFIAGAGDFSGENVAESTDGGTTWSNVQSDSSGNGPHTDEHSLTFDASGRLLNGCDGGIWRLDTLSPANLQWESINGNLATTQFTGGDLHPTNSLFALAGSQDDGTEEYNNNTIWPEIDGGDGGFCKINQTNPLIMYHTYSGNDLAKSTDGGSTWNSAGPPSGESSDFYPHFTMDPSNSSRLLFPTTGVWETTNDTTTWKEIGVAGSSGFNNPGATVNCVGVSGSTVYASAGGSIYVTTNDGGSWATRNVTGFTDHFQDISVNPANAAQAYIVRDRFTGSAGTGHVFFTSNSGSSWTDETGNLPDIPTNAIKVNWTNGTVWVGTDDGVYQSTVATQWSLFGTGLADAQVADLAFNSSLNLLAAYTHGRSAWEISLAAAAPTLTSLSPSSAIVGGPGFTLLVNGSGFQSGAVVAWNGTGLTTTVTSPTQLQATVPATDIAATGTASVTATNPGSAASNALSFAINNPSPVISSLSPSTVMAGTGATNVTVTGTGFVSTSVVKWNGAGLTTTFNSGTSLTAAIPATDLTVAGTFSVTVTNPTPGGGTSLGAAFTVTPQPVHLVSVSISPSTVVGGASATGTVRLSGTAPVGGVTVRLVSSAPGVALPPRYVLVPAGSSSVTFRVVTSPPAVTTVVRITGTYLSIARAAYITVNP